MHYDFRVGPGPEAVPGQLELSAQLDVVVDLAVEDDDDGAVLVADRLVPGLQVYDGQPLDPEPGAFARKGSALIGPPMNDHVAHALKQFAINVAIDRHLARYPAHRRASIREGSGHPTPPNGVPA